VDCERFINSPKRANASVKGPRRAEVRVVPENGDAHRRASPPRRPSPPPRPPFPSPSDLDLVEPGALARFLLRAISRPICRSAKLHDSERYF